MGFPVRLGLRGVVAVVMRVGILVVVADVVAIRF